MFNFVLINSISNNLYKVSAKKGVALFTLDFTELSNQVESQY